MVWRLDHGGTTCKSRLTHGSLNSAVQALTGCCSHGSKKPNLLLELVADFYIIHVVQIFQA